VRNRADRSTQWRDDAPKDDLMKLPVSAGGIPVGSYTAKLTAVENVTNETYGAGLRLVYTVTGGKCAGQKTARTTGCLPTPRNALGKMLGGMLGRPVWASRK
jgi:hypothetical protein